MNWTINVQENMTVDLIKNNFDFYSKYIVDSSEKTNLLEHKEKNVVIVDTNKLKMEQKYSDIFIEKVNNDLEIINFSEKIKKNYKIELLKCYEKIEKIYQENIENDILPDEVLDELEIYKAYSKIPESITAKKTDYLKEIIFLNKNMKYFEGEYSNKKLIMLLKLLTISKARIKKKSQIYSENLYTQKIILDRFNIVTII